MPRSCPRCGADTEPEAAFCDRCGAHLGSRKPLPWWHLHRRLYDWTLAWAYRPSSSVALFTLSFAASSCFPLPPDVLLMPLVLGNRRRWVRYAMLCSVASLLGAVLGFGIGLLLWDQLGGFFHDHVPGFERDAVMLTSGERISGLVDRDSMQVRRVGSIEPIWPLEMTGGSRRFVREQVAEVELHPFSKVGKLYEAYNFWIVFTAGFTPIPFKVITITAGVFGTGEEVARPGVFFTVFLLAAAVSRSARFFLVAGMMRLFGPKIAPFLDKYFNWLSLLFVVLLFGGVAVFKLL